MFSSVRRACGHVTHSVTCAPVFCFLSTSILCFQPHCVFFPSTRLSLYTVFSAFSPFFFCSLSHQCPLLIDVSLTSHRRNSCCCVSVNVLPHITEQLTPFGYLFLQLVRHIRGKCFYPKRHTTVVANGACGRQGVEPAFWEGFWLLASLFHKAVCHFGLNIVCMRTLVLHGQKMDLFPSSVCCLKHILEIPSLKMHRLVSTRLWYLALVTHYAAIYNIITVTMQEMTADILAPKPHYGCQSNV